MKIHNIHLLAAMLAAVLLTAGCGGNSTESEQPEPRQAHSEVERGPVKVSVEVVPADAELSQDPQLTLEIDLAEGVTVEPPVFGERLGDFRIVDVREPTPKLTEDRKITRQVLTLEPSRTGEYTIYPIPVTFTDTRPDGDGQQYTIETEPLLVKVATAIDSKQPSLDELRKATGPLDVPGGWALVIVIGSIATIVILGSLGCWLLLRGRKKANARVLTAREIACMELDKLLEGKLAEHDVKLFYVELTGIVRRYIEKTKGIRAPEQTTEEFLREVTKRRAFSDEHRRRMQYFLEAADLVKFAAYRPAQEDVEASCHRAKEFIDYEQPREEVAA